MGATRNHTGTNAGATRWRPERIPSDVRLLAETAARRAGLPLSLWLGRFVREVSAAEWVADAASAAQPAAPSRLPIPSAATAVLAVLARNLRHADFPPLDEARAYARLTSEFGLGTDQIGAAVGRSREHVARALRLLALPDSVQRLIERRSLSIGHAHALVDARDPAGLAMAIVGQGLSVEEVRRRVDGGQRGS